ncbi:MAG TPA: serine/threonine-protein kinase, partial [Lacipirellulaceae bacterium]|nr:serine/threonine-protein kinase [Lacipirellulaceae bacterium]
MTDLVGRKLKDFAVLRRLGRGAMAEVYLAQQTSLGRQVALKVLNSELALDPNYVRRFHHEARAAAALVHGCIVQIYEVGHEEGVHFIAQEYVPGRNLGEVIRGSGSVAPQVALDIMRQVASALQKAASEGIVHRDIKPENIMLARSGEVKVADFGLARVQGEGGLNVTQIGVTMGTPLYMSPEQIEGRQLDSRSDIYSLGVTAYHMLAGEPPFTGDSPLAVAVQHLNQPAPPLASRRSDVPERLTEIVGRMLAKKPEDRFSDPSALCQELNSLASDGAAQGWVGSAGSGDPRTTGSGDPRTTLSLPQLLQAADKRAEATTRLDDLMKTSAMLTPRRMSPRRVAAVILGCLLLGAALAALSRPRSLLAGAETGPAPRGDVWSQLYQAKLVDTERAWLKAKDFPGAAPYYQNLARQGLVYHYFSRARYADAIEPLEELAAL